MADLEIGPLLGEIQFLFGHDLGNRSPLQHVASPQFQKIGLKQGLDRCGAIRRSSLFIRRKQREAAGSLCLGGNTIGHGEQESH
ncbi:hypothetical protein [Stratiformator vulcanicus]|uniref:hypothetical protein n=1 Tax=Stratiformator vulcanicus TaxID=2527980 RepID=UPI0011A96D1B|nr:hypothetical protein [Stratiformator vulcanicus]